MKDRRIVAVALVAALLVAATVGAYWPVRGHQFIRFDDGDYVAANPMVSYGLSRAGAAWAWGAFHAGNWHPLTWLSHMLDVELFSLDAGRHHLMSLALHCLNAFLLGFLLWRMTGAFWGGFTVAALFALHPLHVESVAWAAERKDVLSTLFMMLTLGAYLGYVRRPTIARYLPVAAALALGLMAKPMLVTLPAVLLLLDIWPLGRLHWPFGRSPGAHRPSPGWRPLLEKIPLAALAAGASILTLAAQSHGGAVASLVAAPLSSRFANALVSYLTYVGKTFWPTGLAIYYPFVQPVPLPLALGAALALGGITWAAAARVRVAPYLTVGWLWFLGTLVPVIGLVRVGGQAMADRYTYIPLIGLFVGVVWLARDLCRPRRHLLTQAAVLTLALLALLAVLTRHQVGFWRDNLSVFNRAVAVTRDNALAHNNLAASLKEDGRVDEALLEYRRAVQAEPGNAEAHNNLGLLLDAQGLTEEAVAEYRRALASAPEDADAHSNLSLALMKLGRTAESQIHYRESIRLKPAYRAEPLFRMGLMEADAGDIRSAATRFEEAVRLAPDFAPARFALGRAYSELGQQELARAQLRALGAIDPRMAAELSALLLSSP